MNVVRSFCDTFRVFPAAMTMEMFMSPVTTPKVRTVMTVGLFTVCSVVYYTTDNPLLAMALAFLLPELLLRLVVALCVLY